MSYVLGHHARDVLVNLVSWQVVVGIGVCGVIGACLLAGPVMGDRMLVSFGALAKRVAPAMLIIGGAVLLLGILTGFAVLDAIGGSLVGVVLLGLLAMNY
jgi:hypothetical protein